MNVARSPQSQSTRFWTVAKGDHRPVSGFGVGGIMGDKEGGQACVAGMIEHESAHPFPKVSIKFGKGFVEEKATW